MTKNLRVLFFGSAALALSVFAVPTRADAAIMHCNNKVCVGSTCTTQSNGPATHCLSGTHSGHNVCLWDTCNAT